MKILLVGFPDSCESDLPLQEMARLVEQNGAECIMADSIVREPDTKKEKKRRSPRRLWGRIRSLPPELISRYLKILRKYMKDSPVDAVVCVNPSMEALREDSDVPCYTLMTDYSPQVLSGDWDGYFVPHDDIRQKLLKDGIPPEKIHTVGMPIGEGFKERMGRDKARRYLALPKDRRLYLIFAEGLSGEKIAKLCHYIGREETGDYSIGIIVSREEKQELENAISENEHLRFLIQSSKLNIVLEAANVLIAKPMGIISAQAAAAGVPLVHVDSEDIREKGNADFFASREMSMKAIDLEDAAIKAKRLVDSQPLSDRMRNRQRRNSLTGATQKLINTLLRRGKERKIQK